MKTERLILLSEFAVKFSTTTSFIFSLEEHGLITTVRVEQDVYIDMIELPRLEKILRLHDDLEINIEGIDAITHLLDRVEEMQREISALENRLRLYE